MGSVNAYVGALERRPVQRARGEREARMKGGQWWWAKLHVLYARVRMCVHVYVCVCARRSDMT